MKKLAGALLVVLLFTGCSAKEEKSEKVTCELTIQEESFELFSTYEVTYTGEIVTSVHTIEEMTIADQETFESTAELLEKAYGALDELEGYDAEFEIDGTYLKATVSIDYEVLDMDAISQLDANIESLLNEDKKIELDTLLTAYKQLGAHCDNE